MNAIIIRAIESPFKLTLPWGEITTEYIRAEARNGIVADQILDRLYEEYGYKTVFSGAAGSCPQSWSNPSTSTT